MKPGKENRILIVRLSSLGDILLTTPLVRSLKKQPDAPVIDFVLREEYKDIYSSNPYVDNLYTFKKDKESELAEKLKLNRYDYIIDLQNNLRSSGIVSPLKAPVYKFRKNSIDKFLLVNFRINRLRRLPQITERYAQSVPGFCLDDEGLEVFVPESTASPLRKEDRYIALCPGSRHFTKMWPKEYYINLGTMLVKYGYRVVLLGGSSDRSICREIAAAIPSALDRSNDNDLIQTAADMKNSILSVCNDSGMMHLSSACGLPVVAIFGSTVEEFGFAPYKGKSIIVENNNLKCRPCSHIGRKKCPKGHFKCMMDVIPLDVFKNINLLISTL